MTASTQMLRLPRVELRADALRRAAIVLLLALGLAAIGVAGWSVANGGIGWDSRLDTSDALVARSLDASSLSEAYDTVPRTSEYYGVFLYQLADVLHMLTTGSTAPLQPDDPATYAYQGAATLLLAVAAVTALAAAIALAFRSLLAAAFAWSLTLSTPLWLGMEHVDFKDMPVAAGITFVTAGLILSFVIESPRRAIVAGVLVGGAGGAVALGTRAGAIVVLAVLAGATLAAVLAWGVVGGRLRSTLPVVLTCLAVPVCGFVFTLATNPIARISPLAWLWDAVELARKYEFFSGTIRTAGKDLQAGDLPWWYVPAWLGAQLPLLTIAAVAGAAVVLVVLLLRRRRELGARTAIPLLPLVLQAVVLPVGIVVSGAVLYDGIRHLLFMLPALVAIPAAALAVVERRAGARLAAALSVGAVVVVAASLASAVQWAPYAYAYVNPVAGWNKDGRSWELDYWGVSARKGVRRLEAEGLSPVYVSPSAQPGVPWGAYNGAVIPGGNSGLYVFVRWTRAPDFGCGVIFTIKRGGHVLGEGARCPGEPGQGGEGPLEPAPE